MGVQHVKDIGSGQFSKDSRDEHYGNVNVTMQRMRDGSWGNYAQHDHPGNAAPADPLNQTVSSAPGSVPPLCRSRTQNF